MHTTGKSVQGHMGAGETAFHMIMLMCTLGMWYPVYKHRKNKLERITRHYT